MDGGPAFPRTGVGNAGQQYDVPSQDGMSLRDYLAAKAMTTLSMRFIEDIHRPKTSVACASVDRHAFPEHFSDEEYDDVAWMAYRIADAMLAARVSGVSQ